MTPQELKDFDEASNHPYECACDKCKAWWDAVGPESDDGDWLAEDDTGAKP